MEFVLSWYIAGACLGPFVYMFVEWVVEGNSPKDFDEASFLIIMGLTLFSWVSLIIGAGVMLVRLLEKRDRENEDNV